MSCATPLASIHYAAYLLDGSAGETPLARQRAQALIERQVRRMTQLVDDLLDISRLTFGRLRCSASGSICASSRPRHRDA